MKRISLLLLAVSFITICRSQPKNVQKPKMLNEHTVVKDATGKILPFAVWTQLTRSREYIIKATASADTFIYTIAKSTEQQMARFKLLADNNRADTAASPPAVTEAAAVVQKPDVYVPKYLPRQAESLHNGEAFKPFKDKDINGEKIDINALKGKIVVLNFWFINCPACRDEMPELNEVVTEYANDPYVVFIGLCLDQKQKIKDFINVMPFNFKHIADARYYGDKYGVNLYPTTVVLDKQGVIRFNSVGADNTGYWIKKTIEDYKNSN